MLALNQHQANVRARWAVVSDTAKAQPSLTLALKEAMAPTSHIEFQNLQLNCSCSCPSIEHTTC